MLSFNSSQSFMEEFALTEIKAFSWQESLFHDTEQGADVQAVVSPNALKSGLQKDRIDERSGRK